MLRPAIVDLEVTAPNTMAAGRSYTLSESAGAMTLYLEFFDSVTRPDPGAGRRPAGRSGHGPDPVAEPVTNRPRPIASCAAGQRALRAALDEVKGQATPAK